VSRARRPRTRCWRCCARCSPIVSSWPYIERRGRCPPTRDARARRRQVGRRASRRSSVHTTAGLAGLSGLSGTAMRRICGRRRFAERHRRDHDATRCGTTVSDGRTLRRRSNWSQRDVRREPDVERGCALPHHGRRRRARRQSSRRFRSNSV
jgi:hypothetical protein